MPHGSLSAFKATLARKKARDVKQRSMFEKGRSSYKTPEGEKTKFPKLSDNQIAQAKQSIRRKLTSQKRKTRIINGIFIISFMVLSIIILFRYVL